jgi:cytochrome c oxidase assembly protein subunit 15
MLGRITVGLFFLLLVWGNLVAGLKAGLGCPDWPLCHGKVLPPFRFDVWMEFTHRLIAAVAAVFLLLLARKRFGDYRGSAKAVPLVAVCLIAAEIMMGGMVVLLEIPVQLTTVHFMTGLTVFLLAFYMMTFDGSGEQPRFSLRGLSALFFIMGLLVFSQAALGAYVRHSGSGLACTDFPTCMGAWIPHVMDWRVLVQLSHRVMGGLILVTFAVLYAATFLETGLMKYRDKALMLMAFCLAQIVVGALVVLSELSFIATAFHLALALGILSLLFHMWAQAAREGKEASGRTV